MREQYQNCRYSIDATRCREISDSTALCKSPLVSVFMVTYNHASHIAKAIEGVLGQETDFPFELVIGEDCSTDGTREIVFEHQKRHPDIIRVITSQENVGAKNNARRTQSACRGRYVAYCEGDDYWHHTRKLQIQVEYLEAHPEVGLVHSDADVHLVGTGKTIRSYFKSEGRRQNHQDVLRALIVREYRTHTCTMVIRRTLLQELRNECEEEFNMFVAGDSVTAIEAASREKIKYFDESLATYNRFPESMSHSKDPDRIIKIHEDCMNTRLHFAKKYGSTHYRELRTHIIKEHSRGLLSVAARFCKPKVGRQCLRDLRSEGVSIRPIDCLRFVGSQYIVACYLYRFFASVTHTFGNIAENTKSAA